jgi:hypothetical protein
MGNAVALSLQAVDALGGEVADVTDAEHCDIIARTHFAALSDRIEVFYLPSYAPELNPDERLNADLKQALRKRVPVRTKAKLLGVSTEFMTALENNPTRNRSFFQDPFVKYAP